jgi:zinc transport system substrate-binding protein
MRLPSLLLVPLLLVAPVTACSSGSAGTGDRPTVVAAAYPFQWLAEQLGGDEIHVVGLVKPGAEPHDVELSPRQVAELRSAKVVLYLKGFQPAVDDAVAGLPQAVNLGRVVTQVRGEGGGLDPHVWLDPVLMGRLAAEVTGILDDRIGPDKDSFAQRGRAVGAKLDALDTAFRAELRNCRTNELVTSHAAFAYLAARYGLVQRGITGLNPEAEPSPKRLAEVASYARAHHVTTIFFESLVSPKIAQTVAAEIGARTAVLDPVEGVHGTDDYLTVQRRNAATLHDALGCT